MLTVLGQDFPPETQEKFEDFEVTRDVLEHNLDVCTHVLSFVEKKPYVTAEYYAWYLKRKSLYNSEEEDSESGATTEEKSEGEASTAETAPDDSASDTADATPPSASASDCAAKAKKGIDESYFKPLGMRWSATWQGDACACCMDCFAFIGCILRLLTLEQTNFSLRRTQRRCSSSFKRKGKGATAIPLSALLFSLHSTVWCGSISTTLLVLVLARAA